MNAFAPSPTDIAVIGTSGRFPGARSVREYWTNLCAGKESVTLFTEDELLAVGVPADTLANPDYVRAGYLLDEADHFDASFFGYAPREAKCIDPQQRVLLECAWQALEQAGYMGGTTKQIGVYVGSSLNTYLLYSGVAEQFKTDPVLTLMSNDKDFLATRIGYKLHLEGPCVTVQTACSTSLVAVHMACQSILAGECDMALAGGVCVKVPLQSGYLYREGGMLSRDGHCRTFDAAATGTIFGSGAGIAVLKRYEDALRDGDTVLAVVKGSAMNNDGARKASYTAPSVTGLAEVIGQSMDFAQLRPEAISYVECHGTGTALGDPIEVHALTRAFRAASDGEQFCALGSVKTNVGHLEAASGIASFIKTVCCLQHRYLPASLHFQTANPALQLEGSPFYVNAEGRAWPQGAGPRTAAVNSLGVGGTNANVILQEAPAPRNTPTRRRWHLLPVSAKSAAVTEAVRAGVVAELQAHPDLSSADAAFTLHVGRREFDWRDVVLVDSTREHTRDSLPSGLRQAQARPVVFLLGDGFDCRVIATLQTQEPLFADLFRAVQQELPATLGTNACAASALAAQVAVIRLWECWGVQGTGMFGDGIGALATLYLRRELAGNEVRFDTEAVHARGPEELSADCRKLLDQHAKAVFLPIGTTTALSATVDSLTAGTKAHAMVPPMMKSDPNGDSPSALLEQAAALWKLGGAVNFSAIYGEEQRRRIPLPPMPLNGPRHWY